MFHDINMYQISLFSPFWNRGNIIPFGHVVFFSFFFKHTKHVLLQEIIIFWSSSY